MSTISAYGQLSVEPTTVHKGLAGVWAVVGDTKSVNDAKVTGPLASAAIIATSSLDGAEGMRAESEKGVGVYGHSKEKGGVVGESDNFEGVRGTSTAAGHAGVAGFNTSADAAAGPGVYGYSEKGEAIRGVGKSPDHAAVAGTNAAGIGIYGQGGKLAALFDGDIQVNGDIQLAGGDCAEDFTVAEPTVDPGTVMVVSGGDVLTPSALPYDKRVAGVISGAGNYRVGIVLDRQSTQPGRLPLALIGKVFCKADASYGSIEIGDLLTTSSTPGHAMKAADQSKAFGSVIGKALGTLRDGQGMIPILVALQ